MIIIFQPKRFVKETQDVYYFHQNIREPKSLS